MNAWPLRIPLSTGMEKKKIFPALEPQVDDRGGNPRFAERRPQINRLDQGHLAPGIFDENYGTK